MFRFASILTVCMLVETAASGGTVEISGSGTWGSSAPLPADSSGLSAPGESWSFSFALNVTTPIGNDTSLLVSSPSYSLNGTPVTSETINTVQFFGGSVTTPPFGLFTLTFTGVPTPELDFYGAQVFDSSGNLIPGSYSAAIDYNAKAGAPSGFGSGTIIISQTTVIPEPSSIISGGIAVLALAGLGLARRRVGPR